MAIIIYAWHVRLKMEMYIIEMCAVLCCVGITVMIIRSTEKLFMFKTYPHSGAINRRKVKGNKNAIHGKMLMEK